MWQDLVFKQYNLDAKGQPSDGGHLHPLLKVKHDKTYSDSSAICPCCLAPLTSKQSLLLFTSTSDVYISCIVERAMIGR